MFKGNRLHILFFSEKTQSARRVSLPALALLSVGLVAVVALFAFAASVLGMNYYYSRYRHAERTLEKNQLVGDRREAILSELSRFEKEIAQSEVVADKLQRSLGLDTGEIAVARGPLSKDEERALSLKFSKLGTGDMPTEVAALKTPEFFEEEGAFLRFLEDRLGNLAERKRGVESQLGQLYLINDAKARYYLSVPDQWPVQGLLTSGFGFRRSPFTGQSSFHSGLDIASPVGTKVFAPSDGTVVFSGWKSGYGNVLLIDHGFGLQTLYAHNSRLLVKEGDTVKRGALISHVGSTGSSTGAHLHYEVHVDGMPIDPMNFVGDILQ